MVCDVGGQSVVVSVSGEAPTPPQAEDAPPPERNLLQLFGVEREICQVLLAASPSERTGVVQAYLSGDFATACQRLEELRLSTRPLYLGGEGASTYALMSAGPPLIPVGGYSVLACISGVQAVVAQRAVAEMNSVPWVGSCVVVALAIAMQAELALSEGGADFKLPPVIVSRCVGAHVVERPMRLEKEKVKVRFPTLADPTCLTLLKCTGDSPTWPWRLAQQVSRYVDVLRGFVWCHTGSFMLLYHHGSGAEPVDLVKVFTRFHRERRDEARKAEETLSAEAWAAKALKLVSGLGFVVDGYTLRAPASDGYYFFWSWNLELHHKAKAVVLEALGLRGVKVSVVVDASL